MSKKIGGDRVKQETVAVNQIWQRSSGTHFIITWIGHALKPILVETFTIETRTTQKMKLSTLLSGKHRYESMGNLIGCHCCHNHPIIRYGEINGEPLYNVGCDCLEFDGTSYLLENALRVWKAQMKYLDSAARCRPGRKGITINRRPPDA